LSERYWPNIHSAARELPQPAFAPYSEFMATAIQAVPADEVRTWQDAALAAKTSYQDTHPSLTDRLRAMGAHAEFAPPLAGNSAEALLGTERARLARVRCAMARASRRILEAGARKASAPHRASLAATAGNGRSDRLRSDSTAGPLNTSRYSTAR
jgi:hypothetical protein